MFHVNQKPDKIRPAFSVIIPARNEEKIIALCIGAIKRSFEVFRAKVPEASLDVIVVINRCTDHTDAVAKNERCIIAYDDSKNLAKIRNTGAAAALGEIIVTVDADSLVSKNMLSNIYHALSSKRVAGGGVMMYPERYSLGILLTMAALVPIALWYRISAGLFYCLRRDFQEIGGFNENLSSVEDVDFARRLKAHAKSTRRKFKTLWTSSIVTSCRKFDTFGDWYFLLHPFQFISLFRGKNQEAADKIWYDFQR